MFCFILGRHYLLSLAEIYNIFPKSKFIEVTKSFCIVSNILREEIIINYPKIGGTIKIIEILNSSKNIKDFMDLTKNYLENIDKNKGKINFAIASYGKNIDNFKTGYQIKKSIKNFSLRLVNNSKLNINSATYKKEKLEKFETELNYIENGEKIYFGKTVVFQDVDKYRERDIKKFRDMEVGMIPPKLAQIMINISEAKFGIYDPFVGLGTIPIEAINSGYKNIFGSDISTELTLKTKKNLRSFFDKKIDNLNTLIFQMDACNIDSKLPKDAYDQILKSSIVTEGLLGEVMTKGNITIEKIEKQRYILKNLYEKFFTGLKKIGFKGNIVISFPFWDLNGKYLYLKEIYEIFRILEIKIQKLLPDGIEFKETKEGSLLYKRDDQQVGREIFKLKF